MVQGASLPLAENAPPVFPIRGFEKVIVFVVSLDPLIGSLVALFGPRESFLRFCALQRLVTLFLFDLPLAIALMTLVGIDADYMPVPGMPWIGVALVVPMVALLILKLVAAMAATEGKVYLVPGVRRIVRRWVPRDPTATGLGTKVASALPQSFAANVPPFAGFHGEKPLAPVVRARVPLGIWVVLGVFALPFVAFFAWVGYAMAVGPDLAAQPGAQIPARFISTLRERGLLSPSETPVYFYSDAMTDIEDGSYFFTNTKLVAYSTRWDPPAVVVPLATIENLSFVKTKSWLDDSTIIVEYAGGSVINVPVPREQNSDERFYKALEKAWKNRSSSR